MNIVTVAFRKPCAIMRRPASKCRVARVRAWRMAERAAEGEKLKS